MSKHEKWQAEYEKEWERLEELDAEELFGEYAWLEMRSNQIQAFLEAYESELENMSDEELFGDELENILNREIQRNMELWEDNYEPTDDSIDAKTEELIERFNDGEPMTHQQVAKEFLDITGTLP